MIKKKTVYLDNNTLIYIVEDGSNDLKEKVRSMLSTESFSFVFSFWNLLEIANSNAIQAENLAKYIDTLKPLWFIPSPPIYHLEVEKFIYREYYKNSVKLLNPFCNFLSEAFTYLSMKDLEIGISALSLIREAVNHPQLLTEIKNVQMEQGVNALEVLRQAQLSGDLKKNEEKIFYKQIRLYVPKQDFQGNPLSADAQEEILSYCYEKKRKFYVSCPIFSIEENLMNFRISDPHRNPTLQDAVDLQHQLLALTYADYFITNDGFIRSGAQYVKKQRPNIKIAETYKTILDISLKDSTK